MPIDWPWNRWRRREPPAGGARVDAASIVRKARRLRFLVRRGAVADLAGAYLGARPGSGLAFAELRPYEPGDDVRHLDWNVTARQGRPFVRRFAEERALTIWLVVDVSASLRFGPEGRTKADRAVQAAALLATAALQAGDRAGLLLVSDRIEAELPPAAGVGQLARLVRALVATPSTSRRTALSAGFPALARARRRALVVILGDFLEVEPAEDWRPIARRHDCLAIRLVDPREEAIPASGLLDLEEAETGTPRVVDAGSSRVRATYARAAEARTRDFRRWCGAAGVDGIDLPTLGDPIAPLIRHFARRASRIRRP